MKVAVEGITKSFRPEDGPAVKDASFTAVPGAITALLGPSGSGKTTLLRVMAGLERPDRGRVLFDDRDISGVPARDRGVGFVFQSFALFNHMTVWRNVAYGLEVRGVPRREQAERVAELLALVQLGGMGDRYPLQLSGGERQRVGFARALACRPRVLLLDEPFAALDTRVRSELREWLVRLHATTPLTTLLVTHDQEEALQLARWIVVMDRGSIVQAGTPDEIYDRPRTPFVASFVGAANVLRGRVAGRTASLGDLSVAAPHDLPDGAEVQAVIRPHDIKIARGGGRDAGSLGTVTRVVYLGSQVRLQLALGARDTVTVTLPRREADRLRLTVGDEVVVEISRARIFAGDYAI